MSRLTEKPLESPDFKSTSRPLYSDSISEEDRRVTAALPVLTDDAPYPSKVLDKVSTSTIIDIPQRYRWTALAFILVYSTGAAFTEAALGPLKSTLLRELRINNAQFSTISTASNIVNTILPTLGGIGMDYVGAVYAAMIASIFCVVGSVVAASSANTGQMGLLIGGRILMGFGSIVIETSQNKLYAHWFKGSTLALVIAFDLSWGQLTAMVARLASVPMSQINGWYGWALWIPSILNVVSAGIIVGYWLYERSVPAMYRPSNGSDVRGDMNRSGLAAIWRNISQLPSFFWIVCGTEIFQNSARTVYGVNLADIQERTRGTSTLAAGFNSAFQSVIQIVTVPILGMFFDRYGWRMPFVSLGAGLYCIVFALIGLTTVNPLAPIILGSFALAFNVLPFIGSIPILINDESLMGTAYGIWSSFVACNNIILEIATGAIQDRTPNQSYDRVIYFLISIKAFQVLLGPIYDYLDGKLLGHSLRKSEAERIALQKEQEARGEEFKGWKVKRWVFWVFGGQLASMILVSWIIYLVYTIGLRQR